jgi:uncharacterized protein
MWKADIWRRLLAAGLLAWLPGAPAVALEPAELVRNFPRTLVVLIPRRGPCVAIDTWVASTPQQRAQGLMNVQSLEDREGMWFGYREPVVATLWMKNTYVSLDMVFVRPDGTVLGIASNTTPLSEARISAGEPVRGVLELKGGVSQRLGLAPGDRVLVL